ncbi:hypothetical protein NQD34_012367 [Periophthalmus magnuspinnatus]|nr:hypothetical protein NQD34_012367 [Periophthalmus magnuspinnatus]
MEMEEIAKEPDAGEGPSETAKTEDEIYSKLQSPSEDLYTDAKFLSQPSKQKPALQGERRWRLGCLCLGVICLILLFTVIVLVMKPQKEPPACEVSPSKPVPLTILMQGYRPRSQNQNSLCPVRWLYSSHLCFLLSTDRKTWGDSKSFCHGESGSLAVVTDPALQKFLTDNGAQEYWVGLKREGGRDWTWVNGESFNENR